MDDKALGRFLAKIEIAPSGCWLWKGVCSRNGYGQLWYQGRMVGAHCLSYDHWIGPVGAGNEVEHACHSTDRFCCGGYACPHRRCVCPDHLEAIPHIENVRRGLAPVVARYRAGSYNLLKTHCPYGHAYDVVNTLVVSTTGERQCRTCNRSRRLARRRAA